VIGAVAMWAASPPPAQAGGGVVWHRGDVLAASGAGGPYGGGTIQHFDSNGNLIGTLDTTTGSQMTGICFDAAGNLYATEAYDYQISKFDSSGTLQQAAWGGPFTSYPQDCLQARDGSIWTMENFPGKLQQWTTSGTLLASFDLPRGGAQWFDLNPDQCVFDFTAGSSIGRFNVCTNSYLSDLADNLPGGNCNAVRIRTNTSVLVACDTYANLVDAAGTVLKSYARADLPMGSSNLYTLSLDPDGTSFWTGDFYYSGDIFRIDIATGNLITYFLPGLVPPTVLGGLAVFGDVRVAADSVPPACTLTAVLPGPPKQVKITVQDNGPQQLTSTAAITWVLIDRFLPTRFA